MKFKVGDKVVLKKGLVVGKLYGCVEFMQEMHEEVGDRKYSTVTHIAEYDDSVMKLDKNWLWFDENMLKSYEEISDMDEINEYELMLIRMQIIKVDGVNDDEYSAWKSILEKVRKYNAEHE